MTRKVIFLRLKFRVRATKPFDKSLKVKTLFLRSLQEFLTQLCAEKSGSWVSENWSSEEQDMRFSLMEAVVLPAARLLDPQAAPLFLFE